ncbi:hypothetical protein J4734_11725 [Klebsiella pneumoniae]|uniref:Uncharacterized protein n=1 Tax=Klebsiella pneumoniae TaxID=573 RepID=A0A939NPY8_KLEPN|nr:hypothetical protein [Klebsiella pneumoniae]
MRWTPSAPPCSGTALAGGRGRVTGSIIGAFVIVFLADGMVMMASATSGRW